MSKPPYYLWRNEFQTSQEFEKEREKYRRLGFRVITFLDGKLDKDINEGMKAVIGNHIEKNSIL